MDTDKEFADKVREIIAEYTTAFKAFGDDVIAAVKFEMEKGMDIRDAVQKVLEDLDFESHNTELVAAAVVASAIAGFGLRPEQVTPEAKAEIKKVLLKKPWSADGMKLSERLHGVDKVLRQNIISTVTASVNNSDGVIDMARKLYDGYNSGKAVIKPADLPEYLKKLVRQARFAMQGDTSRLSQLGVLQAAQRLRNPDRLTTKALKRAYKDLVEACAKLETEAVDKALWTAVQEKSRYYAERIARTESARAWHEGYMADSDSDDDVAGFKYTLSSAHKRKPYDICDVYANADFGFGKGIWPKGRQPEIPVHPHCMCYYSKVFKWQLKGEWKPEKAREYINSRSAAQKQLLFGKEGAARYLAGEDWQKLVPRNATRSKNRLSDILNDAKIINKEVITDKAIRFFDGGVGKFIPRKTVVTKTKVIAGKGSNKTLRVADKLADKYKTSAQDWQKFVGVIESDKFIFDVHWYGHKDIGNVEFKVKNKKVKGDKK